MLKPGDKVVMVNCYEARAEKNKGKLWTITSDPWIMCGSEVVMLEGKSGGFATEYLEKVKAEKDNPNDCKICKEPLTDKELAKGKTCVDCDKAIVLFANKRQAKRVTGIPIRA